MEKVRKKSTNSKIEYELDKCYIGGEHQSFSFPHGINEVRKK